jgi:hypothetical protein
MKMKSIIFKLIDTKKMVEAQKRFEIKKWNAVALWAWGNDFLDEFDYSYRHPRRQLRYLQKPHHGPL